jgi:hypothetical protein
MKTLLSLLAISFVSASAIAADLDLKKELSCEGADGTKILVNSALSGGVGKAIAGSGGRTLRASAMKADKSVQISLDGGFRSAAPDYTLVLDLPGASLTSRQEGADSVHYIYVPGILKASGQEVALKCFQDAN